MRNSTRRRLLLEQYDRKDVIDCFRQMMNKHHTLLERDLRRSTLRRRLAKANCDLDKSIEFDWVLFSDELSKTIVSALTLVVKDVYEIESSYWQARHKTTKILNIIDLVSQYGQRTGYKLENHGKIIKGVLYTYILEWFSSDKPFSELMKAVAYYFSESYIESIILGETTRLIAQISLNNMQTFGLEEWDYEPLDSKDPELMNYAIYNPHNLGDPFPPLCLGDKGLVTYRGSNV